MRQHANSNDLGRIAFIVGVISLICLFFVFGCRSREEASPPPSSSYDMAIVMADAQTWASQSPGRIVGTVAPTGSMLPFFGSNALLLLEPVNGLTLTNGDVATYKSGDTQVVHRVDYVNSKGDVIFHGDNNGNMNTDGYIAADKVAFRVAGILYAKREKQ